MPPAPTPTVTSHPRRDRRACDRVCMARTDGERVSAWEDLAWEEGRAVLKAVRRALGRTS